MVVYKSKLVKTEPVFGELPDQLIEMWATFEAEGYEIEVFLDNFYVVPRKDLLEGIGKFFNIDFSLMTYDIYRINVEEKMLKQITRYPGEDRYGRGWPSIPMYFLMGEVVKTERVVGEYRGRKSNRLKIKVDCGLVIDTDFGGPLVEELRVGDYVAIIGKMFGEIVKG